MTHAHGHRYKGPLKGLVIALAFLILAWTSSGYSQEPPRPESRSEQPRGKPKKRPLTPEQRKHHEVQVKEMEQLLKEAREGRRDEAEKYVILRHLLQNYATLDAMETAEAKEALGQWKDLLQRRPDLKANPPREIKEQRQLREQTEAREREIEKKAETFVPKDARAKVFWSGRDLAAVYQFRVEFYQLPEGVECLREYGGKWQSLRSGDWQGAMIEPRFARGDKEVSLKPRKTISFGEKVSAHGCERASKTCDYFAIYSEKIAPTYSYNDDEEMQILRKLQAKERPYRFHKPSADYQEFYGVFAVGGQLLGQVPFKAEHPNKILKALYVYPDGTALFGVGKAVTNEDDRDYSRFGDVEEVIAWSRDRGVALAPLREALEKHPALKQSPWLK